MKKILGLDIGTNSIGWALITEPENGESGEPEILRCGVKVIAMDQKQINAFEGGQALSANQERRLKRQMRRNNWRYKLRREALVARLVELGWFPREWKDDLQARHEALKLHDARYIYGLRDKAARGERITLRELGLIWYHLNQKRGYKSNRKAQDEEESNDSVLLSQIAANDQLLREQGLTVGQYLYQQHKEHPRRPLKGKVFSRKAYLEEFDRIWEAQAAHYPDILTPELREEIRDRIIYYQRPLKSQKHLIAECPFEKRYYKDANGQLQVKGIKVAPRSSPVFQEYKIWQTLANIRITNLALAGQMGFDDRGERPLTEQERELAYQYLIKKKKVKSDTLLKRALRLDPEAGGYSIDNYEEIEGDVTRAAILSAFKKAEQRPPQWLFRFDPTREIEQQPLFQLWHMLYSIEDPAALQRKLREKFDFDDELAAALTRVTFKEDYGSLSTRAMQRLIPHLKNGLTYDKARVKVYEETGIDSYKTHTLSKDEQLQRALAPAIEQIKVNSLRNPVVERIVQHVINLVNAIIADKSLVSDEERQSGKFEIRMEMARELKQTAKQRQKTSKQIRAREQQREAARNRLIEEGILTRPSRADIDRYLIWLEGNQMCPYTFKPIPISDLFSGRCDVDHIIPRSRLFDDSQLNKVVCYAAANKEKGNRTAYEYMEQKGELEKFREHVMNTNYPFPKKKRLLSPEVPEDFIQRQLKETQYITKVVREKLREVSHEVRTTTGAITGFLRHEWGLSNLLHDLNFPKYEAQGLVEEWVDEETGEVIKRIEDWSKRMDHRHHALDALVVALTRPAHVHYLNNLNKQFGNLARENGWRTPLRSPVTNLYQKARAAMEPILVKHQKKSRVVTSMTHRLKVKGHFSGKTQEVLVPRGPLHKESVYGLIHDNGK
ncbi:MAG: type II CRISPR RNA-guided endonuclease Cas9, partial [Deltaproteobacteria bacterium]